MGEEGRLPVSDSSTSAVAAPKTRLVVGSLDGPQVLSIDVLGRTHPGASDYCFGNWYRCRITARMGGFALSAEQADLRRDELHRFRAELDTIQINRSGTAALHNMDDWIELKVRYLRDGSLRVWGHATDQLDSGHRLFFHLDALDPEQLPIWISQLSTIENMLAAPWDRH